MNPALRYLAVLPALLFILSGLRWAVDPGGAAASLGMPLLDGVARSSQIGDTGAFFLAGGLMIGFGILRQQKLWFLAAAILVGFAAIFRVLATLLHGAPLPVPFLAVEVITVALLYISAKATKD